MIILMMGIRERNDETIFTISISARRIVAIRKCSLLGVEAKNIISYENTNS